MTKRRIAGWPSGRHTCRMPGDTLVAVVDDDDSVRGALVRLLRSADFAAAAFSSAHAFLRALPDTAIDCLILDLQMPEMPGLDLQRRLRSDFPDLRIPVIVATAYDEPGLRERCFAAGASVYLRKPVDSAELLAAVAALTAAKHPNGTGS